MEKWEIVTTEDILDIVDKVNKVDMVGIVDIFNIVDIVDISDIIDKVDIVDNRKWNYFSHFRSSDQKTSLTKVSTLGLKVSKQFSETGNGNI